MIRPDQVFSKSDHVISRKIADELILVPVRRSVAEMESLFTLNEVGARIYELIDGERTVGTISGTIVEEFEVSRAQAETDVNEFLEKLTAIDGIEEIE
jgi:hypothetical protein